MSIISLAHLIDQTEIAYRLYVYSIYIFIYRKYFFFYFKIAHQTYRIERCVDISVWTIRQGRLLEINLNVIGRWGGGATSLRLRGIQQHFKRGNGMQLSCLLVHFAWNIIFVIVIVCGFFLGGCSIKMQCFHCIHTVCVCVCVCCGGGCVWFLYLLVCVVVEE